MPRGTRIGRAIRQAPGRGAAQVLAVLLAAAVSGSAAAQVEQRAEPITGPGITTIGNIPQGSRVNLRAGPSVVFPSVGTLGYGTRVRTGLCVGLLEERWCQVDTADGTQSGFVAARFLVQGAAPTPAPPPDAGDGGPDYWAVRGLPPGDRLNVRRDPTAQSPALATLGEGEVVRNLGCRTTGGTRWCRIRSITGMDVTGWVAGRYLREAAGPPAGGGSGAHGPDSYVVTGLPPGDRLNVRTEPSARASVLATLGPGERVRNLGCQMAGQTRWCRIRTMGGVDLTGWVNGRYLREG